MKPKCVSHQQTPYLQSFAVHAHVPVAEHVVHGEQLRHDRVQPVRVHLGAHRLDQCVRVGHDPSAMLSTRHHDTRTCPSCCRIGRARPA